MHQRPIPEEEVNPGCGACFCFACLPTWAKMLIYPMGFPSRRSSYGRGYEAPPVITPGVSFVRGSCGTDSSQDDERNRLLAESTKLSVQTRELEGVPAPVGRRDEFGKGSSDKSGKGGGKQSEKKEIKVKRASKGSMSEDDEFCPTCLEAYTAENPKITAKCDHHFHLGCIYEWLERSSTCPVCFRSMKFEELT